MSVAPDYLIRCPHGNAYGLATCAVCDDLKSQQVAADKYQAMCGQQGGIAGLAGMGVQSIPLTAAQHIAEAASHIRQAQEILSKVK